MSSRTYRHILYILLSSQFLKCKAKSITNRKSLHHSSTRKSIMKLNNITSDSMELPEILEASGSDKFKSHHYELCYGKWLFPYREQKNLKLLEIGANKGLSLMAWAKYFSNPLLILGLSYTHSKKKKKTFVMDLKKNIHSYNHKSISIEYGDQSKKETLDRLCRRGPFDIIIDDGSHVPNHVIFSFFNLWHCLTLGGLYVIEDLETSFWDKARSFIYGYKLNGSGIGKPPPGNALEKVKQIIDVLMKRRLGIPELSIMPGDEFICNIDFGMNIVAIRKCKPSELETIKTIKTNEGHVDMVRMKNYIQNARKTNVMK